MTQAAFTMTTGGQTHNYFHYSRDSLVAVALHTLSAKGLITARTGCGFSQSEPFITQ